MGTKIVSLRVNQEKEVISLKRVMGVGDKPIKIQAQPKAKYQFADSETGKGPEHIITKRVGDDLYISFDGKDVDSPSLIIENYYDSNIASNGLGELQGVSGNGQVAQYLPDSGQGYDAVGALHNGAESGQMLSSVAVGVAPIGWGGVLLAGLGAVGVAVAAGGGDGGDPVANPKVSGGALSPASDSGVLGDNKTNDASPTLSGNADPGSTISVKIGDQTITTTVGSDGTWSITVPNNLPDGTYTPIITATTSQGGSTTVVGTPFTVDTTVSATTGGIDAGSDSGVAGDNITNNTTPTLSGTAEPGAAVSVKIGEETITTTAASDGTWSVTPTATLADGSYTPEITVTDTAGNTATTAGTPFTVDTAVSPETTVGLDVNSNSGSTADSITNDTTPTISGTAEPGSTVSVVAGGQTLSTKVAADGTWSVTPPTALADGDYAPVVTVTDPAGNTSTTTGSPITIDTTVSPATTVGLDIGSNSGSTSDNITNDTTPTLNGTAEPGATVSVVIGGQTLTATAAADGTWSVTPTTALTNGDYTPVVTVTDAAGNSATTVGASITIDTVVAPATTGALASSSDSGLVGDNTTNSTTPTISGTAEPGATIKVVVGGQTLTATAAADGTWSVTAATLAAGTYTPAITTTDKAGNTATSTATAFTIDTSVTTTAKLDSSSDSGTAGDNITNDNTPTISGVTEPGASVKVVVGGQTLTTTANASGAWSVTPTTVLADNTYTPVVTVTDVSGNTATVNGTAFKVDTVTTVTVALASASDTGSSTTDNITKVTTPTFSGTAEPGASIKVVVGGQTLTTTADATTGAWSVTAATLPAGSYAPVVTATDKAGNTATAIGSTVTIDTAVAPATTGALASSSDSGLVGDNTTNSTTPTISGTAEPGATVSVVVGGQTLTATAAADGTWSVTAATLAAGTYTPAITTTDKAGNTATSTAPAFTIDTSVTTTAKLDSSSDSGTAGDNITNDNTPTISGVTEPGASVKVVVGSQTLTTTADSTGAWSVTAATLADNTYTPVVTVTDVSGNTATVNGTAFKIDTVAATNAVTITASDNAGTSTGALSNGAQTDDTTPTYTFTTQTALTTAESLKIYDNGTLVATLTGNGTNTYTWTPTTAWTTGSMHSVSATIVDAQANTVNSTAFNLTIQVDASTTIANVTAIADNVGSVQGNVANAGTTDDPNLVVSGTLTAALNTANQEVVQVYDNGVYVGNATVTGTTWSFVDPRTLSDATTHVYTAKVANASGLSSAAGSSWTATIDTSAPAAPSLVLATDSYYDGATNTDGITNSKAVTVVGIATGNTWQYSTDSGVTWTTGTGTSFNLAADTTYVDGQVQVRQTDAAGNTSTVGYNGTAWTEDQTKPTVALSGADLMASGGSQTITFTFSEDPGTTFDLSDTTISGGTWLAGSLAGSGLTRTATFVAGTGTAASIKVASGVFTDIAGNANADGTDGDNALAITINNNAPKIALGLYDSTNTTAITQLLDGQTAVVHFDFTQAPGTSFSLADVTITGGGVLTGLVQVDSTHYTATYTPPALTSGNVSLNVASGTFQNSLSVSNVDGSEGDNTVTVAVDTIRPTVAISTTATIANAEGTAPITFTFSEDPGTSFTLSDVVVTGGTLSGLTGAGLTRTANFTPTANSTTAATFDIASGTFADAAGNLNVDGGDRNNYLTLPVDTIRPTVAMTANTTIVNKTGSVTLTFTFSEDPGTSFALSDITQTVSGSGVTAGTLSNLTGTGTQRQVTYTPNSTDVGGTVTFSVADGKFTDAAGNNNADGGDTNNSLTVTVDTVAPSAPGTIHFSDNVWATGITSSGGTALASGAVQDGDVGLYRSSNGGLTTDDTTPTFWGAAGSVEANATVKVYSDSSLTQLVATGTADSTGAWSATPSSSIAAGQYTFYVTQTDLAGNVSLKTTSDPLNIQTAYIIGSSTGADVVNNSANATGYTYVMQYGDDTVTAGSGADVFYDLKYSPTNSLVGSGAGADTYIGGAGNDAAYFGAADVKNDSFDGGAGYDTVYYHGADAAIVGDIKIVGTQASSSADVIATATGTAIGTDSFTNVEGYYTGNGNDTLDFSGVLGATNLTLIGYMGNDTIIGGAGNDTVTDYATSFGGGNDTISLGGGNDTLNAGEGGVGTVNTYDGGDGADTAHYGASLSANINPLTFTSDANNKVTVKSTGTDTNGVDTLTNFEVFYGSLANDSMDFSANTVQALTIGGNAGDDVIKGTQLADNFSEYGLGYGAGSDTIYGLGGNDSFALGSADGKNNSYDGGTGQDTASYGYYTMGGLNMLISMDSSNSVNAVVTGAGGIGTDTLTSFETYGGSASADTITVDASVTGSAVLPWSYLTLYAREGNDTVNASAASANIMYYAHAAYDPSADTVTLGSGNDQVVAGLEMTVANDSYDGGAGRDLLLLGGYAVGATGTITLNSIGSWTLTGYSAGTDTFSNFEAVQGAQSGVDNFVLNYSTNTIAAGSTANLILNGFSGLDVLTLGSGVNFSSADNVSLQNVPIINMNSTSANTFTISNSMFNNAGVVNAWSGTGLTSGDRMMMFQGTSDDTLDIDKATWTNTGTTFSSGGVYDIWHNSALSIAGDMLIQQGISVI